MLVDERGAPLSLVVSAANRHDSVVLEALLQGRIAAPANDDADEPSVQHLCLDAGYVGTAELAQAHGFTPHIRPRGAEKLLIANDPNFQARRWVVELTHSWFNRYRKLVPRYEKTDRSYRGLTTLAAAMIVLNKVTVIYR